MCSKLHDPAHFKVKTHQTVALRAFSAAVFVDSSRDTRDYELWMLEHSLLRSSPLSCSTPRLSISVKSDFGQSCLDRSAVWTQRRDRSFNTCNLILRLSDLPTYQRAALSVPFNEVCHWRGDDQEGPRWCVKPAGKQSACCTMNDVYEEGSSDSSRSECVCVCSMPAMPSVRTCRPWRPWWEKRRSPRTTCCIWSSCRSLKRTLLLRVRKTDSQQLCKRTVSATQ